MSLLEFSNKSTMTREAAAEQLRRLADQLARHNDLELDIDGRRYTVEVPDEVSFEFDLEIGEGDNELEIEIKW